VSSPVDARDGLARAVASLVLLAAGLTGCHRTSPAPPFAGVVGADVILVTIDTLRADAPHFAGNARVSTPNLDRLAAEGIVFTQAHAHNVVTLPSHANILTGLYPYEHGVRDNEGFRLSDSFPTLATLLKAKGYATGAFIGGFPLDSRFGLARGFDVYDERYPEGLDSDQFVLPERRAAEVVAAAQAWFAGAAGHPRFLWIHLYDCHAPYRPPSPFDSEYAAEPYLGEVAGVDRALEPLVRELKSKTTTTFLVVTSDHGEALGDHGEKTHGLFAYEATLHVPLVLWSPGRIPHAVDASMARHIDILPTVLEAVGLPAPKNLPGISLLSRRDRAGVACYFEALSTSLERGWAPLFGVMKDGYKFIDLPSPELYELRSDPEERRNRVLERSDVVRSLRPLLPMQKNVGAPSSASDETAAKLRSLGYLGGRAERKDRYGVEDDPKRLVGVDGKLHDFADLFSAGKLAEAERLAREVVAERPAMATGYEYLSLLQAQRGDTAAAIQTLEEARRRNLLDERLESRLALLYSERGASKEALALLANSSRSNNPDVWNALGIVHARARQLPEAMAAFDSALRLRPNDPITWQNIGITYLNFGRSGPAREALEKALAANDRLPRAWNARGVLLDQEGKSDEAIASWRHAVELEPGLLDAWMNIAVVAGKRKDVAQQRDALSQFIARAPEGPYASDVAQARRLLAGLPPEK
jgi:arylsulfatase A-like enzyme/Flp pilus assembly protein TadD